MSEHRSVRSSAPVPTAARSLSRRVPTPPSRSGLLALSHAVGNRAVAAVLTGEVAVPTPLQRDFVPGLHADVPVGHEHRRTVGDQFFKQATTYSIEIADLTKQPLTEESARRLDELGPILRSHAKAVEKTVGHRDTHAKLVALARKAEQACADWRKVNEEREAGEIGKQFANPALAALVETESCATHAAQAAAATIKAATTASCAADVDQPAQQTARACADAREHRGRLTELAKPYLSRGPAVGATVESYARTADRAVALAERMAALAEDALSAWRSADHRGQQADEAVGKAASDLARQEADAELADHSVDYLTGFQRELAIDVAEWRKEPTADQGALDTILADVAKRLVGAQQARQLAHGRVQTARETVAEVTEVEHRAVGETRAAAAGLASKRAGEADAALDQAHGAGTLRTLAGGVEAADRLLAMADQAQLLGLIQALGVGLAETWLTAAEVGPTLAVGALAAFGVDGLRALVAGIADSRLRPLLTDPGPVRLAELVSGLGESSVDRLAEVFRPSEVEAFVSGLGVLQLAALLGHLSPASLKALGVPAPRLAEVLARVPADVLGALVGALGETKAKDLLGTFAPAKLAEILADLPPDALRKLDTTAAHLKSLLADFTGGDLRDLALTGAQLKATLKKFTAQELKTLAGDLTYARVRKLVLAFPADELKAMTSELASPGNAVLIDLFTEFSATQLRTYRTTVGAQRLKLLIEQMRLGADALATYGAPMLKTFVGVGGAAWTHLTTAKISNTSQEISGAHDEAVFLAFIGARGAGVPTGKTNAKLIAPFAAPAAMYKVYYETHAAHGGKQGSKSLIQDLAGAKDAWLARFREAVWQSIRTLNFPVGGGAYAGSDATGQWYGGFFTQGAKEVDTIYPVI